MLEDAAEETLTWGQVISAAASIKIRGRKKNQNGVSGAKGLLNWKKKNLIYTPAELNKLINMMGKFY